LEYPLNTGVHFFFLYELANRYLVEAYLNLLFKPFVMGKQPSDGFLHQIVSAASSRDSKLVELRFLIWRQMYFHGINYKNIAARTVGFSSWTHPEGAPGVTNRDHTPCRSPGEQAEKSN
jgi:hypothetical protein